MEVDEPVVSAPDGFTDISLEGKPGLFKKIIRSGETDDKPVTNDVAFVHYVGTLYGGERDGEKFDSSRDRDSEFDFTINAGEVIQAWEVGVCTMNVGEVCELVCSPCYGYGEKGSGIVPANSTLKFEIELLRIKCEDLTENKDGGVTRRVLEKSDTYGVPGDASQVEVDLCGCISGQVQPFDKRIVKFDIGDGFSHGIPVGIEIALKKMKKGERSKICIRSHYGFGKDGNSQLNVPANADLEYNIKLQNFEKLKESYELHTTADRVAQSISLKEKGTEYYKRGNVRMALVHYERIISYFEHEQGENEEDTIEKNKILVAARLNCALCHIKESELAKCVSQCEHVLEIEPNNEKAIYRLAQAEYRRQNIGVALEYFRRAVEVNPDNVAAKQMSNQCIIKQKQHLEAERKMCKNIFSKLFNSSGPDDVSHLVEEDKQTAVEASE